MRIGVTTAFVIAAAGVPAVQAQSPAQGGGGIEVVAELEQGPGNLAITPDGRIILSQHQFYGPDFRVVELLPDGSTVPFPSPRWAGAPDESGIGMTAVLGIRAQWDGVVWMLDNGGAGTALPKLVGWDTVADRLHRVIHIPPPATHDNSFHNDFALDVARHQAYIADFAGGANAAIVAVDLETGVARRLLEGHHSVVPEDVRMVIDGDPVQMRVNGQIVEPRIGLNPITIDPASEWVYYGAMHGTAVYRVPAAALADPSLSADALAAQVDRYGDKPVSDGISIDSAGNVYVTDLESHAIGVTGPDGGYRILYRDPAIIDWPDAISYGADGRFYATVNRLHDSPLLSAGERVAGPPFYVIRFDGLAHSAIGR